MCVPVFAILYRTATTRQPHMTTQRRNDWAIKRVEDRKKLEPDHDPYWLTLSRGRALGYRKMPSGHASWIARWTEPEITNGSRKKYIMKTLAPSEGTRAAAEFDEASTLAGLFFAECAKNWDRRSDKSEWVEIETVADAVRQLYISYLRSTKGNEQADRANRMFATVLYGTPYGNRKLRDLREHHTQQWVLDLVTPTRKAQTANRIYRQFRAAMKFAKVDRAAWIDVAQFPATDGRRNAFLKPEQLEAILAACERVKGAEERAADEELRHCTPDLANFIRAVNITGARPGEVAKAKVKDFDPLTGTLVLTSSKNKRGVAKPRDFYVTAEADLAFFKRMAKDKLPAASLMTRADGSSWLYSGGRMDGKPRTIQWCTGLRAAIRDANKHLPREYRIPVPTEQNGRTTMYTNRHTAITNMLDAGIEMFAVTDVVGTSEAMLRKHYDQNRKNRVREQMKLRDKVGGL